MSTSVLPSTFSSHCQPIGQDDAMDLASDMVSMPDGEISALQIVGDVLHLSQQRKQTARNHWIAQKITNQAILSYNNKRRQGYRDRVQDILNQNKTRRGILLEEAIRDGVVSFWYTRAPLIAPEAGTKRSNNFSRCDLSFTSEEICMSREDFCQYIKTHKLKMGENLLGLKYLRQARRRFKMRFYKVASRAGKASRPVRNPALLPKRTDPLDSQSVFRPSSASFQVHALNKQMPQPPTNDLSASFFENRGPMFNPKIIGQNVARNNKFACDAVFTPEEITMSRQDFVEYVKTHGLNRPENALGLKYLRQARRRHNHRVYKAKERAREQ